MGDFTEDEIRCLKKLIYKVREEEILELYNESRSFRERITKPKSFSDKVKAFFKGLGTTR